MRFTPERFSGKKNQGIMANARRVGGAAITAVTPARFNQQKSSVVGRPEFWAAAGAALVTLGGLVALKIRSDRQVATSPGDGARLDGAALSHDMSAMPTEPLAQPAANQSGERLGGTL